MRKSFFYMVVFTLLLVLGISSCGKPELKKIRGIVKNVRIDDDTLKNLTVMDGEDSIVFNLNEVRYNNGVMLPNDSVIVDYIDGKNDTARALVVTVLPKKCCNNQSRRQPEQETHYSSHKKQLIISFKLIRHEKL